MNKIRQVKYTSGAININQNILDLILLWITESSDILNSIKWLKNNDSTTLAGTEIVQCLLYQEETFMKASERIFID